jgi:hypothetical protein
MPGQQVPTTVAPPSRRGVAQQDGTAAACAQKVARCRAYGSLRHHPGREGLQVAGVRLRLVNREGTRRSSIVRSGPGPSISPLPARTRVLDLDNGT